ncbi:hypothetical protein [Bythopirellula polymerisocia]|uniref:4Fe-4S ferredoxin-type domain-containing protein n=1 Tax=Bythopirellula polymerisocia TaxID=2528003 RepID=A0A5C6CAL0_9BACT|nr:hypothetical protein [Bythopirellula polymerisocia]TWU21258.1 hypothetical protein Pla144_46670 [Bythopirellula polymerisocia]
MKNQNSLNAVALIALAFLLGTISGCVSLCGVSDESAYVTDPGCGYANCVGDCSEGYYAGDECPCNDCAGCLGAVRGRLACARHRMRIPIGPPAVRYRPEMPPEFLPVPVTPIYANVNPNAPQDLRGEVEVGWAPPCQLTITGRD